MGQIYLQVTLHVRNHNLLPSVTVVSPSVSVIKMVAGYNTCLEIDASFVTMFSSKFTCQKSTTTYVLTNDFNLFWGN